MKAEKLLKQFDKAILELMKLRIELEKVLEQAKPQVLKQYYISIPYEHKDAFKDICAKLGVNPVWDLGSKKWMVEVTQELYDKLTSEVEQLLQETGEND